MPIKTIIEAIQNANIKDVRKETKDRTLESDELDTAFVAAARTAKKNIIEHIEAMGSVSSLAITLAVMEFVKLGKQPLIEKYIAHIDDVGAFDSDGRTLASYAAQGGKQKIIDLLEAHGADFTRADVDGTLPLFWALQESKAKAAKWIMAKGLDVRGERGQALIAAAPNKTIKQTLIEAYLAARPSDSSMTREQFVSKWGPIEAVELVPIASCDDPAGEPIMKGTYTTAGYFPRGIDYAQAELDWDAVDAAKTLSERIVHMLKEARCSTYVSSATSTFYHPFFIPSLGRTPKTDDFDARATEKALASANGTYRQYIGSFNLSDLFTDLEEAREDYTINDEEYETYTQVNVLAKEHLDELKYYELYEDFVTFPIIFGGLDTHYNFVGVIAYAVCA